MTPGNLARPVWAYLQRANELKAYALPSTLASAPPTLVMNVTVHTSCTLSTMSLAASAGLALSARAAGSQYDRPSVSESVSLSARERPSYLQDHNRAQY